MDISYITALPIPMTTPLLPMATQSPMRTPSPIATPTTSPTIPSSEGIVIIAHLRGHRAHNFNSNSAFRYLRYEKCDFDLQ